MYDNCYLEVISVHPVKYNNSLIISQRLRFVSRRQSSVFVIVNHVSPILLGLSTIKTLPHIADDRLVDESTMASRWTKLLSLHGLVHKVELCVNIRQNRRLLL